MIFCIVSIFVKMCLRFRELVEIYDKDFLEKVLIVEILNTANTYQILSLHKKKSKLLSMLDMTISNKIIEF